MIFDDVMMGVFEVYVKNNQVCIVFLFIVGGVMVFVFVVGILMQVMVEVFVGIVYSQFICKGVLVIFGVFVILIDMGFGVLIFGMLEVSQIFYGVGQLVCCMGLLFWFGGGFCGFKLLDVQVVYEIVYIYNVVFMGGVNFMFYSCGWFEGGLVFFFEKFVMDVDQFGILQKMVEGIVIDENG